MDSELLKKQKKKSDSKSCKEIFDQEGRPFCFSFNKSGSNFTIIEASWQGQDEQIAKSKSVLLIFLYYTMNLNQIKSAETKERPC